MSDAASTKAAASDMITEVEPGIVALIYMDIVSCC
jgi:hypothetical protein